MTNRSALARRVGGRFAVMTLVVCAVTALFGLVLISPLALNLFPPGETPDYWQRLSYIGQTYGATSALLSMLAFGGIALSLLMQNREAKAAREQGLRALHVDLIKTALDDPTLLAAWGPFSGSIKVADGRQHMYINLMVSHWQMMWEVGALREKHLRLLARELFEGAAGRRFWSLMGDVRLTVEGGKYTRRFHVIMADEYDAAVRTGLPVISQEVPDSPGQHPVMGSRGWADPKALVACSLALGAAMTVVGLRWRTARCRK